jgi:hypothetical protein
MGTVLSFKGTIAPYPRRDQRSATLAGEIVIFPGVRIERHEREASPEKATDSGSDGYDGLGGNGRPRKSS